MSRVLPVKLDYLCLDKALAQISKKTGVPQSRIVRDILAVHLPKYNVDPKLTPDLKGAAAGAEVRLKEMELALDR